ncbi:MAG: hypothetical protein CL843_10230 [Crocinitomicaceae bacterium]|nr:hypothetical protein [Crocinitomicaceae bacterium]
MENKPILSVVVCTYKREEFIRQTLEHLQNQTADKSTYEVMFVDNNSPDRSAEICKGFQKEYPELNLSYFLEMNQGHTFARNRGITESIGKYISFIDDDAFVHSNYVNELIHFFDTHPDADALGGKIIPVYEGGETPNWMTPFLLTLVAALDMGENPKEFKKNSFPIGANIAFRKEVFDKHGLFDVNLGRRADNLEGGDEKEIIYRIKRAGAKVMYAPKVIVDHFIPKKRTEMEYIKRLGTGVGRHERKRITKEGFGSVLKKAILEVLKIGATVLLFLRYLLTGSFEKGWTLVKFRYWVLQGLIFNQ